MKYLFCSIIFFVFLHSCTSQEKEIIINRVNTKLPIKIMLSESYNDSTRIRLMIPQEFEMINYQNSKIDLEGIRLSITGSNVFSARKGYLEIVKDSLLSNKSGIIKLSKQEKYKVYACYHSFVTDIEKNIILNNSNFSQKKYNQKIYNINEVSQVKKILFEKIPDSLKGYIQISFYNNSTKEFFAKNIPIKF